MFEATLTGEDLDDVLTPVTTIVDECRFHLNDDELATSAVDPANVAMVDFAVDRAQFEEYSADGELVGLNLERFGSIAGMADKDDDVRLGTTENNRLNININDQLSYNLNLIDPDSIRDEPDIPDLDVAAEVTLTGADLNFGIEAAEMVSDHVALRADPDAEAFYIEAEGDTDDVDFELDADDDLELFEADEEVASLFALDYLSDMASAIPDDALLTINLGNELPVIMEYEVFDGNGDVTFMLAPRIEAD